MCRRRAKIRHTEVLSALPRVPSWRHTLAPTPAPQGRATSHPVHDCLVKITSKTAAAIECFKIYFYQRGLSRPPPTCSLHVVVGSCPAVCPNDSRAGASSLLLFSSFPQSRKVPSASDGRFVWAVTCVSNNTWLLLAITGLVFLLLSLTSFIIKHVIYKSWICI